MKLSEGKGICTYCQYWDINCGETCPKCGRICDGSQIDTSLLDKNKPKELEWEKEFVNEFCDPNDTDLINEYEESWRIKNFISKLLTQQRTELLEEITDKIHELTIDGKTKVEISVVLSIINKL